MRYGRVLKGNINDVPTPQTGLSTIYDIATKMLLSKDSDGVVLSDSGDIDGVAQQNDVNILSAKVDNFTAYGENSQLLLVVTKQNTAAVQINVNGLGLQPVYIKIDKDLPATFLQPGTHMFIYKNSAYHWAGTFENGNLTFELEVDFRDFQPEASDTKKIELGYLPRGASFLVKKIEAKRQFAGQTQAEMRLGFETYSQRWFTGTWDAASTTAEDGAGEDFDNVSSGVPYNNAVTPISLEVETNTSVDSLSAGEVYVKKIVTFPTKYRSVSTT